MNLRFTNTNLYSSSSMTSGLEVAILTLRTGCSVSDTEVSSVAPFQYQIVYSNCDDVSNNNLTDIYILSSDAGNTLNYNSVSYVRQ